MKDTKADLGLQPEYLAVLVFLRLLLPRGPVVVVGLHLGDRLLRPRDLLNATRFPTGGFFASMNLFAASTGTWIYEAKLTVPK